MRKQYLYKAIELRNFGDLGEEMAVMGVQGNPQGHFVLSSGNAVFDNIVDDCLVLLMFFGFSFTAAALDIAFNALVDQNLSELVLGVLDIELSSGSEGILECLIIVVEVEIEFGKEEGDERPVLEGAVLVDVFTGLGHSYMRLMSFAMSIQCKVMWDRSFRTPISFRSFSSSCSRLR